NTFLPNCICMRAPCVKTFLHGGQKRLFNTTSNSRMTIMPAWEISRYGSNDVFRFTKNAGLWTKEVILKVHAAGLNHIDVSMRGCCLDVQCFFPSQVWAAIPPWKHGSLAEIVVLSANVPKFLSHTEVAAAPYVSVRAWSALVNSGGLNKDNCAKKQQTHTHTCTSPANLRSTCLFPPLTPAVVPIHPI
uniref:Uncharacterized protein n=1 Tax=Oncorhynchus mykiss TaxID=8022 RepID=A0A8C7VEA6_ONCMY